MASSNVGKEQQLQQARDGDGKGKVQLLGMWQSPYAMRARFALGLKDVPYEVVESPVFEKSELLLKSNPALKKIPVLLHDGRAICESMIIVEYVDSVWRSDAGGAPIVPADPYDRAVARFWTTYIDEKWFPYLRTLGFPKTAEAAAEARDEVLSGIQLLEEAFGSCSKGGAFFGGESLNFLDIALGSYITWIKAVEKLSGVNILSEPAAPLLTCWAERFSALEVVKDVAPEVDSLVEFFETMKAKIPAWVPPAGSGR